MGGGDWSFEVDEAVVGGLKEVRGVGEEGVAMRKIAEAIGARWNLPVESLSPEASPQYFGAMAGLAALDLPASSVRTQRELGWHPTGPDLLTDLRRMDGGG